jgi:hypothetical protein
LGNLKLFSTFEAVKLIALALSPPLPLWRSGTEAKLKIDFQSQFLLTVEDTF